MNYIRVETTIFGSLLNSVPVTERRLGFAISESQAREMQHGEPPPSFDRVGLAAWVQQRDRAEHMARFIASEIAAGIMQALNPAA